jgi:hypothetical protein
MNPDHLFANSRPIAIWEDHKYVTYYSVCYLLTTAISSTHFNQTTFRLLTVCAVCALCLCVCVCVCVCTVGTNGAHCFVVERSSHPSQTIPVGELHLKSRKTEEFRLTTMLH